MTAAGPADPDGLERTRDAVVNVLLADGLAIALSGWALSRTGYEVTTVEPYLAQWVAFALLVVLIFCSIATRRLWAARRRLADPGRRAGRLLRAHVTSALVGAMAIPIGFVFSRDYLAADMARVFSYSESMKSAFAHDYMPTLLGVAPFWIVALAMGLLALPRDSAVEGLGRGPRTPADGPGR